MVIVDNVAGGGQRWKIKAVYFNFQCAPQGAFFLTIKLRVVKLNSYAYHA